MNNPLVEAFLLLHTPIAPCSLHWVAPLGVGVGVKCCISVTPRDEPVLVLYSFSCMEMISFKGCKSMKVQCNSSRRDLGMWR